MKTILKKLTTAALSLAALLITGSALAVEPVAIWEGANLVDGATYTKEGGVTYTLHANENTVGAGGITISANNGVSITPASGNIGNQASTVIIRYTNYDTSSLGTDDAQVLIMNHVNTTADKDFIGMAATGEGKLWGIWQNTKWGTNKTGAGYGSVASDTKTFAFTWAQSGTAGAYCWMNGASKTGWSNLHGGRQIDSVWVGGPNESTTLTPATGMKILGIAVFDSRLADNDIASFKWPSIVERYQPFMTNFSDRIMTITTSGNAGNGVDLGGNGTFALFDTLNGADSTTTFTGGSATTKLPGKGGANVDKAWKGWASNQGGYSAPGLVMRFPTYVTGRSITVGGSFAPFTVGGLIVEEGASSGDTIPSWTHTDGNRYVELGDNRTSGGVPTFFVLRDSFKIVRGDNDASKAGVQLYGDITFDIAADKYFDCNTSKPNGKIELKPGAIFRMVGEGKFKVSTLTATGSVTLDYSKQATTTTFITGNLTIDNSTTILLPPTLEENAPFTLCSGALTGAANCVREITMLVGGEEKTGFANLTFSGNTVSYAWPAATSEVTINNDMSWNDVTQLTGYNATVPTTATLTKDVTITFGATATVLPLTFTGPYTATLVYEKTPSIQEIKLEDNAAFKIVIPANSDYVAQSLPAGATSVEFITATGANFNFGANNFIYNYTGSAEISPTITGTGTFTKSGSGTLCVNFGQSRTAETIIDGGVLKTTAQKALGNNTTITINADGVLDYNGYSNNGQPTIVLNGGTLRNTRESQPTSQMQILNIRLTASSKIDAQMDFGLVGNGHCQTTLELGEHTLTKTGNGQLHIVNTVVSGSGTIKVDAGSLHVSDSGCTMLNGALELNGGNLALDAAFTLKDLTIKDGAITGNGALTLTNFKVDGTADMTARALPLTGTLTTDSTGTLKIAKPTKPTKIIAGSAILPAGLTIVDADGNTITDVCVYDGFIWYGTIGTGTYTVTTDDENALKAMADGDIYSSATFDVTLSAISGTPEGFFGWVEDHTAYFAKKSNSISIKLGTRTTNRDSRILTTDTNVGGFPVAGKFWNVAKVSNGNAGNPVSDYTTLWDGNGVATTAHIAYYAVNTYFAANSPTPFTTGNERLLGTYLDDGDVAKATTWTITASSDGTEIPEGGVTLPATPNNRGWEVQLSDIPYDMYDLYVYIASDQSEDILKACPVVISVDNGTTWSYYVGEAKGTDSDYWSPLAYSHDGVVTEGKNYIRFRVSKNSTGVEDISTILLSHGTRNTAKTDPKRLGLAGIQIVEIDDDGMRDRKAVEGDAQNWHDTGAWVQTKKDGTTIDHDWVDSTSSNPITARINASEISTITMDSAATVNKLEISGAADTFTIEGEGALTATSIDATDFTGNIVFEAPVTGALSLGANAKLVVEIDDGEEISVDNLLPAGLTIASGNITITGSGTLVCDGELPTAYQSSLQAETWTGTVWIKNITEAPSTGWNFNNYGNNKSTVRLTNIAGWLNNTTLTTAVTIDLVDGDNVAAFTQVYNSVRTYVFNKLTGTGTFKANSSSADNNCCIAIVDVSEFNGAIVSVTKPIVIGANSGTQGSESKITFADGVTVKAGLGLEAETVAFGNTLNLVSGTEGDTIISGLTAEPAVLPVLTIGGQPTSLVLKYEEGAIKLAQGVAVVNGTGYATFAEALSAAITAGDGTAITIYETVADATVEIPENTNIIITDNIVGGQPVRTFSGDFVKTGAGTLTMKGWFGQDPTTVTVSAGTLVLSDEFVNNYGRPTTVAEGAVFEINTTIDNPSTALVVFQSITGAGTVRKTGTGYLVFSDVDVMNGFNGMFEVDAGTVVAYDVNLTINNCLKINGDGGLYVQAYQNDAKLLIGANALVDISEVNLNSGFVVLGGTISLYSSTTYKLSTGMKYGTGYCDFVAGKVLCDGEEIGVGAQKLLSTIIYLGDTEYTSTLVYDRKGSQTEITRLFYADESKIVHIADNMTATALNAAIAAAGFSNYATVYFDNDATLTLEDGVTVYPILAVCEGNVNFAGTGSLSIYTIALNGESKTINIAEGVTVTPTKSTVLDGDQLANATITGAGTIVYDGALPGDEKTNYQNAENWTGTVWLKNKTSITNLNLNDYGNANSTVTCTGIAGYFANNSNFAGILKLENGTSTYGLNISNGSSNDDKVITFEHLAGKGKFLGNGSSTAGFLVKEWANFTGDIQCDTKTITFGTTKKANVNQIIVNSGATYTLAGQTWSAAGGIKIDGTIGGTGTLGSNTTFGDSATIDASAGTLQMAANKTVTFGATLNVTGAQIGGTVLTGLSAAPTAMPTTIDLEGYTGEVLLAYANGNLTLSAPVATVTVGATVTKYGTIDAAIAAAIANGGTVEVLGASETYTSAIALSGNLTINVPTDKTLTLTGAISSSGKLTKVGAGTLQLGNANNSFTGGLDVQEGIVKATATFNESNGAFGNTSNPITVGVSGTLDFNQTITKGAWAITSSGAIEKSNNAGGTGYQYMRSLTLAGDTTITGLDALGIGKSSGATSLDLGDNRTLDVNVGGTTGFFLHTTTVYGKGTIAVTGGKFQTVTSFTIAEGADVTITLADDATTQYAGSIIVNGKLTVPAEFDTAPTTTDGRAFKPLIRHDDGSVTYESVKSAVVGPNNDHYETIEEAINNNVTALTLENDANINLNQVAISQTITITPNSKKLVWTDSVNAYIQVNNGNFEIVEGKPANGRDSFENYVLGLSNTEKNAKPFLRADTTANVPGCVVLELGGLTWPTLEMVTPKGATVEVAVEYAESIGDFEDASKVKKVLPESEGARTIKVELPKLEAEGSKVRYYRPALKVNKITGNINTTLIPSTQINNDPYDWYIRHNTICAAGPENQPDVVLIGDSITHYWWGGRALAVDKSSETMAYVGSWEEGVNDVNGLKTAFPGLKVLDCGFGYDRIENMLWRIQNGELDGISPKLAVIMAGTNNMTDGSSRTCTAEEIIEGLKNLVAQAKSKLPNDATVVVMGILPRDQISGSTPPTLEMRRKAKTVNDAMAAYATTGGYTFVDISSQFVNNGDVINGTRKSLYIDTVHPNAAGYAIWAEALQEYLPSVNQ